MNRNARIAWRWIATFWTILYLNIAAANDRPPISRDNLWIERFETPRLLIPRGKHLNLTATALANAKIHYVGLSDPGSQTFDEYGVGIVHLEVTDTSAPLVLIAGNVRPVHWDIRPSRGVNILTFLSVGRHRVKVSGLPNEVPLRMYAEEDDAIDLLFERPYDAARVLDLQDGIVRAFGRPATTVQSAGRPDKFLIDGASSTLFEPGPALTARGPPYLYDYFSKNEKPIKAGADRLLLCCSGRTKTVVASRSYMSGAWYFEARLQSQNGDAEAASSTSIGIIRVERGTPIGHTLGSLNAYWLNPKILRIGDIIGIAADFDHARLRVSLNGQWINVDPMGRIEGLAINPGRDNVAAFSVGAPSGDHQYQRWDVNLGQRPFGVPLPARHQPYAGH